MDRLAPVRSNSRNALLCGLAAAALLGARPASGQGARASGFPASWYFEGSQSHRRNLEDTRAPELAGVEWEGAAQSLRALRGKIVVIDFWAAWCPPCRAALLHDVDMYRRFRDRGVVVLGVHDGSQAGRDVWQMGKDLAAELGVNFPIGLEGDGSAGRPSASAQYSRAYFPFYVIVDRAGVIRAAGLTPARVADVVEILLAEQIGGAVVAEFPSNVYAGGDARPTTLQTLEGRTLPDFTPTGWVGDSREAGAADGVRVIQFLTPGSAISVNTMRRLVEHRNVFEELGVSYVAIAGPGADRSMLSDLSRSGTWSIPIAMDAANDGTPGVGRMAWSLGIGAIDPIIVVDRRGVIRAAGLKPDAVADVVRHVSKHEEPTLMSATTARATGPDRRVSP